MIETVLLSLILFCILLLVFRLMIKDAFKFKLFGSGYALNRHLKELLSEKSVYGVIATDLNGKILMFNERSCKKFGYKEHEMIGQNINKIIPERFGIDLTGESNLIDNDEGIEWVGLHKNGNEFPIHLKMISIDDNGFKSLGVFVRNITKDKTKENALVDKIKLLETGERCADMASWYWHLLGNEKKIVQVSDNFYKVFDIDETKIVTADVLMEKVYTKDSFNTALTINRAIEDKKDYKTTYRRLLDNGDLRLIEVRGCLIFNEENEVIAISGTIQKIKDGVD
jgi:PAS domain S-box-containing protein